MDNQDFLSSQRDAQNDTQWDEEQRQVIHPSANQPIDSDFIDRVNRFIDRYRSALESLAQR